MMKRIFFLTALITASILVSETAEAKPKKRAALGYWTVQDHVDGKADALVRFYNTNDSLVFEQNVGKKQLELNRKNIKRLNKELRKFRKSQQNEEKFMITKL